MDSPIVVANIVIAVVLHVEAQMRHVQVDIAQNCQYDFSNAQKTDQVANKRCNKHILRRVHKGGGHIEFGIRGC